MGGNDLIERPDWGDGERGAIVPTSGDNLPAGRDDGDDMLSDRYGRTVSRGFERERLPMAEARKGLPSSLVAEWDESGAGADWHLQQAQSAAIAAVEKLDPETRGALIQSFDNALPEAVTAAILAEMGMGSSAIVRNATDSEVDEFASSDAGRILVHEWRGHANRNVATVGLRINRIIGRLSESDAEAAYAWLDNLSPKAQAGALRALVTR